MKVGVIMGGTSSERQVSLNTGREIVSNLNTEKYEVVPIVIDKKDEMIDKVKGIDFALLALHGKFGEDGTVQGVLETLGIPYSGSGVLSSSICMDKDITKRIIRAEGVQTADWAIVRDLQGLDFDKLEKLNYPVVIKPNNGGSSVATFIASNKEDIMNAVSEALKYDNEVMIEQYIKGDEITCCVLNGHMLPVLAIKPKSSFFDYTSKYSDGEADEFVVELRQELHDKVQRMALKCYEVLKCGVYSRVDMIIKDGEPYVLEVNTLPGMTKNSLFPKSARSVGITFIELLDLIIEFSLKEKR